MPNKFLYTDVVVEKAAEAYGLGSLTFNRFRTSYRADFKSNGAPRGTSNTIRIPVNAEFQVKKSLDFQTQPALQRYVPLTINKPYSIDVEMTIPETTFLADSSRFSEAGEVGRNMGNSMQAEMDCDLLDFVVKNTNMAVNVEDLDKKCQNLESLNIALEQLQSNSIRNEGLNVMTAIISPRLGRLLRAESRPLYNPSNDISQAFGGQVPKDLYGFQTLVSNRLGTHKTGAAEKKVSVEATFVDGSDVITCSSASQFRVGDPVYLRVGKDSVMVVEPYSKKATTGKAMRKIKAINSNQIILSEAVYISTGFQNVDALPTHIAAVLSPNKTYTRSVAAHADSVEYAFVDITTPSPTSGVLVSSFGGKDDGVKLTAMYGYLFKDRSNAMSLIAFGGFASPRPDWATTIYIPEEV